MAEAYRKEQLLPPEEMDYSESNLKEQVLRLASLEELKAALECRQQELLNSCTAQELIAEIRRRTKPHDLP